MAVRVSEYVDIDIELDDFYRDLDREDKVWLVEQLSKDPEARLSAPTLTDLVGQFLGATSHIEQDWLKSKIEQLEWDFRNRNFT